MNAESLVLALKDCEISNLRYFDVIGSTNDEAALWAESGAADYSLVIADQQIAGRGRLGRKWVTQPGAALAFSLVLRPTPQEQEKASFFSLLGAAALCQAIETFFSLQPQIKWPNDLLLNRRKAAGILAEANWQHGNLYSIILGIGVNITPEALPPVSLLQYPATSIETELQQSVNREVFLKQVLLSIQFFRKQIGSPETLRFYEERLAFLDEWVSIHPEGREASISGKVLGITPNGCLRIQTQKGQEENIIMGDLHLRPLEN